MYAIAENMFSQIAELKRPSTLNTALYALTIVLASSTGAMAYKALTQPNNQSTISTACVARRPGLLTKASEVIALDKLVEPQRASKTSCIPNTKAVQTPKASSRTVVVESTSRYIPFHLTERISIDQKPAMAQSQSDQPNVLTLKEPIRSWDKIFDEKLVQYQGTCNSSSESDRNLTQDKKIHGPNDTRSTSSGKSLMFRDSHVKSLRGNDSPTDAKRSDHKMDKRDDEQPELPSSQQLSPTDKRDAPDSGKGSGTIPPHLSFIVAIEPIAPNFDVQLPRISRPGLWIPPDECGAFRQTNECHTFRWQGGRIMGYHSKKMLIEDIRHEFKKHQAATIFTQSPSSPHLLAVPFDVRMRGIRAWKYTWKPVSFDHVSTEKKNHYLSYVSTSGDQQRIAAPASSHWKNQLLRPIYDYATSTSRQEKQPAPSQAGLIGNLTLLIALAAFSAPDKALGPVLEDCMRPGVWRRHRYFCPPGMLIRSCTLSLVHMTEYI